LTAADPNIGPSPCTAITERGNDEAGLLIAVHNPRDGSTPEAMANPMASGNATTPTVTPAARSDKKVARS